MSSRLPGGTRNGIEFTAAGRTKPGTAGAILSIMLNPVLFALLEKFWRRPKRWKSRRWKRQSKKRADPSGYLQPCATGGLRSCRHLLGEKLLASDIPLVVIETSQPVLMSCASAGSAQYWAMRRRRNYATGASGMCKMADPDDSNGYEAGEIVASARAKNPDIGLLPAPIMTMKWRISPNVVRSGSDG